MIAVALVVLATACGHPRPAPSPSPTDAPDRRPELLDVSFVDTMHGLSLWHVCPTSCSLRTARSDDGGATWSWTGTVTSGAYLPGTVRLATASDGYVIARTEKGAAGTLFATHDGGKTWQRNGLSRSVQLILTSADEDEAISGPTCRDGELCSYSFATSIDHGRTWHQRGAMPKGPRQIIATRTGESITVYAYDGAMNVARLLATTNDGVQWSNTQAGCVSWSAGFSADPSGELWLICGSQPGAGQQLKSVYRSGGSASVDVPAIVRSWRRVAGGDFNQKQVGVITEGGYVSTMTAMSSTTAFLATDRGTLLETTDGGVTWKQDPGWKSGEDFFHGLTFVDPSHGWVAAKTPFPADYADKIYRTTDGGKTWRFATAPKL